MREIKFRAFNKKTGGMIYSDQTDQEMFEDQMSLFFASMVMGLEIGGAELTYMQFTGLLDKNGKEIFEGDKCTCKMNGIDAHIEYVETEVIYDITVGAFGHKVISESEYTFFGLNSKNLLSCEIIGNVFEKSN